LWKFERASRVLHKEISLMRRKTARISPSLLKGLNTYALTASAAGVGLLALTQPTEAEVVYTPVHVLLHGTSSGYNLDVNNDGVIDFTFQQWRSGVTAQNFYNLSIHPSDGIEAPGRGSSYLTPLKVGAPIGGNKYFFGCYAFCYGILAAYSSNLGRMGRWFNVSNHYLGLKFFVGRDVYFGWARLSVRANGMKVSGLITGYAFENISGHPIHAGQTSGTFESPIYDQEFPTPENDHAAALIGKPATEEATPRASPPMLGALAVGANGFTQWRRERPTSDK
jgi:hypothetical protein